MKIAVIGAGKVGRAIGEAWRRHSREIRYGVRDPAKRTDGSSIDQALRDGMKADRAWALVDRGT